MEASCKLAIKAVCRNKVLRYGRLIISSWLLACIIYFQFHIFLFGHSSPCDGRRIYILDLPSRFNLLRGCHQVEGSSELPDNHGGACTTTTMCNAGLGPPLSDGPGGWFKTDDHALEVIFHGRMRRYDCLTDDPAAATAVYVPYYPGTSTNVTLRQELLQWLAALQRWMTLRRRHHFIVASRPTWMFRNMTVLTYESNIWERRDMAVPYPTFFHPSSSAQVATWQARARHVHRPWLFAFAGRRSPNGTLFLQKRVIDECAASSRCGMLHGRSVEKVMSLYLSSRFCLQPRGTSFTRRSSIDAVIAGCIPVFFQEASTFEKQYQWHKPDNIEDSRYSVFIDAQDFLQGDVDIEEVLSSYTDQEVAAMREEVIKMMPRFLYKDPRVRFQGDLRDGFDIAIDKVMERTRRINNGKDLSWN